MDEAATLAAIHSLRTNPAYQAAEVLRRKTADGARAMASAPDGSQESAAIHLLISTWETIALLASGLEKKDKIFEVTPVCHMHHNLKDALTAVSLRHAKLKDSSAFNIPNAGYGANFSILAGEYDTWLRTSNKSAHYISGACDGMYACFG
jgi:hypothetical protein